MGTYPRMIFNYSTLKLESYLIGLRKHNKIIITWLIIIIIKIYLRAKISRKRKIVRGIVTRGRICSKKVTRVGVQRMDNPFRGNEVPTWCYRGNGITPNVLHGY